MQAAESEDSQGNKGRWFLRQIDEHLKDKWDEDEE